MALPDHFRTVVDRVRRRVARGGAGAVAGAPGDGPVDIGAVVAVVQGLDASVGAAVRQRSGEVIKALSAGPVVVGGDTRAVVQALVASLEPFDAARAWLLLATINGRLPESGEVRALVRVAELDGIEAAAASVLVSRVDENNAEWPLVRVLPGRQLIDVHLTAASDLAKGIQRVTRELSRRWVDLHEPTLIGWLPDMTALRALSPAEAHRACWGGPPVVLPVDDPVVVPWKCTYLLPELAIEIGRMARLQAMAEFSGSALNIIGHDLVPLTNAETCHPGLVPGFGRYLAAARYARNIITVSEAAAVEFRGWRDMLAGTGSVGPRIEAVALPTEEHEPDPETMRAVRERLMVGVTPLVLVVGTHEPRKNHIAVLHAAELLWREGHRFSLTFIGGHSWTGREFSDTVERLRRTGHPVEVVAVATDDLLWGAYHSARFTVFPSLSEGFGLPAMESLVCGTPVVTSDFGSMKEIAAHGGGALLVDPRDDDSIADGMRALLTDDALHASLSEQARARQSSTWDDYADRVWAAIANERHA